MLRRALLVLSALAMLAPAASATCIGYQCIGGFPGSIEGSPPPGDGVLCGYKKDNAPPPSDWDGAPNSDPPYAFVRTQAWGDSYDHRYGKDWNWRLCPPL